MPLGFQRLNQRTHRPNENINFIKPLAASSEQDQEIAKDFLERIAAQCYPIMKKEYISVMALEEYPPNPEFLGRNFNAGEVIQLVLKDKAGRWLSFKYVQMVMMHELAHCKQMNHSRYFWQARNKFAEAMQGLWAQKYTGEGLWGRGQDLENGSFVHDHMPDNADIPEHLCGGTYRRRGKKRKRGQDGAEQSKMTYAEKQQRRIKRKFGKHGDGHDLGEDELVRGALERGKRQYGKPRVANSKRGRELRANAALARFEVAKQQSQTPEPQQDDDSETESESDDEYGDSIPILEKLGEVTDQEGHHFFKVDEGGEDDGGEGPRDEMNELKLLATDAPATKSREVDGLATNTGGVKNGTKPSYDESENEDELDGLVTNIASIKKGTELSYDDSETEDEFDEEASLKQERRPKPEDANTAHTEPSTNSDSPPTDTSVSGGWSFATINNAQSEGDHSTGPPGSNRAICLVCTLENNPSSPTCMACANVLKSKLLSNHWRCKSDACKGNKYINSPDAGRCGLCGSLKPTDSKPMGVTAGDVLRWD